MVADQILILNSDIILIFVDGSKHTNYETRKTTKYKQQVWRIGSIKFLVSEDCFVCTAGRKLRFQRSNAQKEKGTLTTYN